MKKIICILFLLTIISCAGMNNNGSKKLLDLNYVYNPPTGVKGDGKLEITDYYRDDFDYLVLTGKTEPSAKIQVNNFYYDADNRGTFKIKANVIVRRPVIVKAEIDGKEIGVAEIFDNEEPAAPTGLDIVSVDANRIELRWNENRESDLYGYNIYVNHNNYGWKRVNRVDEIITKTEYTISRLHSGMSYKVRITAYDKMRNESAPSDEREAVTLGEAVDCCGS